MSASITSGQRKQLARICQDAGEAAPDALQLTGDQLQLALGKGDVIRAAVFDTIREICLPPQFADEEEESRYGYLSGYKKPAAMAEQIVPTGRT